MIGQDPAKLTRSSIGKKAIVAITGLLLLGFLVAHMLGNMQIFLGQDALNTYAKKLKSMPQILWMMRSGLLVVFVVHVVTAILLAVENRKARPIPYAFNKTVQATYVSRVMVISGVLILIYVIYHISHFTTGSIHSQYFHFTDSQGRHDVYSMVVASFQNGWINAAYVLFMGVLCFHLGHAAVSFSQTLGWATDKNLPIYRKIGLTIAVVLFAGYVAIPLAVTLGIVKLPGQV